jgi:aspartate/methionine/tyrosine aminotransferase
MPAMNPSDWIADRARAIEASGIRKIFDLALSLPDPVNLSIGQPHFDVPAPVKAAAQDAIDRGLNGYTVTQGAAELRDRLRADVRSRFPGQDREVLVTSGTSGGLLLALLATVNPSDEVIVPDPYFVSYPHLVTIAGGRAVFVDTYPNFRLDPDRVRDAVTDRTKVILQCSPANPTGAVSNAEDMRAIAELARDRGILLVSDEIYRAFHYDGPARSPAEFNPDALVIEGFGKTYGMTGWRLGYAHGPKAVIDEMAKLQQMTFVCAPTPFQYAGLAALDYDVSAIVADYRRKRDLLTEGLRARFEFALPGGAFYLFPKAPWGTGTEFATAAVGQNLLIIPGVSFSRRDTHVRISYAAPDDVLRRGVETLNRLAGR